jgi:hypothetical protein
MPPSSEKPPQTVEVVMTKTRGNLPEWVDAYMQDGLAGIERLLEYQDKYVFVSENKGTNFNALSQWVEGFSVVKGSPRLMAARVQERFNKSVPTYPDAVYGSFFEATVKAFADARYTGLEKQDDYWMLQQVSVENGVPIQRFGFLILITAEKEILIPQINAILAAIPAPALKEQAAAANHIKEIFLDEF